MSISDEQRAAAIDMLKNGRTPEAVHVRLLELGGGGNDEIYAFVSELVRLKNEAAARDPARLREEGKWILLRGGTVEHVIAAFAAVGVAEEHSRPEAEKLLALVRTMRPCERCRMPVLPKDVMFDTAGRSICPSCHTRDEIVRSEQRGIVSELESVGMVSPLLGFALSTMVEHSQASAPPPAPIMTGGVCARCRVPAVHPLPPHHAAASSGATWLCHSCGATA
jgi:hypothetical protein